MIKWQPIETAPEPLPSPEVEPEVYPKIINLKFIALRDASEPFAAVLNKKPMCIWGLFKLNGGQTGILYQDWEPPTEGEKSND